MFDQAVREIKREVNLKVLKVPEIEQKVLDATNDEPWGPHGSALAEIAQETKKFTECQMIMNVLWTRLTDTGPNWRHVYKSLTVIEYLIGNGSERAVDDIIEHGFQISSLSGFEYAEPNGKDMGINVRKKVETILGLLNDRDKIKAVRDKAASNRDKYVGLSSRGITYKSSASSFSSSGDFHQKDRYGETRVSREGETFSDSYKDKDQHREELGNRVSNNKGNTLKSSISRPIRDKASLSSDTLKSSSKQNSGSSSKASISQTSPDDDFDDFDPRGSSVPGTAAAGAKQVNLFGDSLLIDLMDAPATIPTEATTASPAVPEEVDLFADATFVSAPVAGNLHSQETVDLFDNPPASFPSKVDLFSESDSAPAITTEPSKSVSANSESFDPFAQVPLNNFEDPDIYGAFTSSSDTSKPEPLKGSENGNHNTSSQPASTACNPPKKDTFQIKSGIWADSLSRGLIDLNITAPKKVSLADVGVVGGLDDTSETREKAPFSSGYMGAPLSAGSSLGWSAFPSSMGAGSSAYNSNQQQYGSFK